MRTRHARHVVSQIARDLRPLAAVAALGGQRAAKSICPLKAVIAVTSATALRPRPNATPAITTCTSIAIFDLVRRRPIESWNVEVVTKGPGVSVRFCLSTDLARLIWATQPLMRFGLFEAAACDLDRPPYPDAGRGVVIASPVSGPETVSGQIFATSRPEATRTELVMKATCAIATTRLADPFASRRPLLA